MKDENVAAADFFINFNHHLTVREVTHNGFSKRNVEMSCDCLGKFGVGIARKDHEIIRNHRDHDITHRKLRRESSSVSLLQFEKNELRW